MSEGALDIYQRAGEGLADTLERLTSSIQTVNPVIALLGDNALEVTLAGADAASALLELTGGLEAFGAKTAFIFENFQTDQQKLDIATEQLENAFDLLDLALPETHEGFMNLLHAQDLMTEEGRAAYSA